MERKTMGGFIAALRKANGMTQKELAEQLNVSDKTVSRWERDDGAPDLSLIPVIAELFGVTCDELLRGERRSPAQREENPLGESSVKGEKQRQRILASGLSQYKNRSYITMGLSVLGLIAAAICNLGFLRSFLGFLFGCIFYAAGAVCQAVFYNNACFSVAEENSADPAVNRWKRQIIAITCRYAAVTAALFGFTLPLLMGDTYSGIVEAWPLFGLLGSAFCLLLFAVVWHFLKGLLMKRGSFMLEEKEAEVYWHNHGLRQDCGKVLLALLAATLLFQAFGSELLWSSSNLAPKLTFDDYDSFVSYMEQDIPYLYADMQNDWGYSAGESLEVLPPDMSPSQEEAVEEEEYHTDTVTDRSGKVLCTYRHRNQMVGSISYTPGEGTALPITVITHDAYRVGAERSCQVMLLYSVLYPLEFAAVVLFYRRKRISL